METSQHIPEWKATANEIWAILRETAERQKETDRIVQETAEWRKETDRILKETAEQQKKTDRIVQETAEQQKKTDRMVQETAEWRKETAEWQKETDRVVQETAEWRKETDRILKETDRILKETAEQQKETWRIVQELSKNIGGVSNRLGEVAQCFFSSELWKHFYGFGYEFQQLYPYLPLFDENNKSLGDIDITLLNGEYAMAIEVKTHLKKKNVEHHATRMEQIKQYPPAQYKGKKALAGLAALTIDREAKDLADELGMYVIEPSGDAVRLAPRPAWFTAREW
jgi:flagellar biosynthesis GTPase FlhF